MSQTDQRPEEGSNQERAKNPKKPLLAVSFQGECHGQWEPWSVTASITTGTTTATGTSKTSHFGLLPDQVKVSPKTISSIVNG